MGTYVEPFNLKLIFINYFLGSQTLFVYALIMVFSLVAAKFNMSDRTYALLLIIASVLASVYIGESLLILVLIIIGFVSFKFIPKVFT